MKMVQNALAVGVLNDDLKVIRLPKSSQTTCE